MDKHRFLAMVMPFLANIVFGVLLLIVYFIYRANLGDVGLAQFFRGIFIAVLVINMIGVPIYYEVIWWKRPHTIRRVMVPAEIAILCNFVYFVLIFWIFHYTYSWVESVAAVAVPVVYEVISYWAHKRHDGKPEATSANAAANKAANTSKKK